MMKACDQLAISVVVPCWNEEQFLAKCLDSLLHQTLSSNCYEVILVDNCSTDRSLSIARQYPEVRVVSERKRGAYSARNAGVRIARGRLLAFTDADCIVAKNWLETIVDALAEEKIQLVIGPRRFARDRGLLLLISDYENTKVRSVFELHDLRFYYGYTNNLACRQTAFQRCGPFVELLRGADAVFVSFVVKAFGTESVHFTPNMWIRHLEITTWMHWPKKMWIYGQSYQAYRSLSRTFPLTLQHRFRILRQAVGLRKGSWRWPAFLFIASLNAFAYAIGRLRGRLRSVDSPL